MSIMGLFEWPDSVPLLSAVCCLLLAVCCLWVDDYQLPATDYHLSAAGYWPLGTLDRFSADFVGILMVCTFSRSYQKLVSRSLF